MNGWYDYLCVDNLVIYIIGFRQIIESLQSTLEEIDVTDSPISSMDFVEFPKNELKTLPNLKILNAGGSQQSLENIKVHIPHLSINEQDYIKVAESCQTFQSDYGFWDIESKQLQMFQDNLEKVEAVCTSRDQIQFRFSIN